MNKAETTVSGVKATLRRNWTGGCTSGQLFTLEIPENAWLVETYVKTTEGLHRYYAQDGCIKGYLTNGLGHTVLGHTTWLNSQQL